MQITEQIRDFISLQNQLHKKDLEFLHTKILEISPDIKLWFETGIDENNKVVCNPTIGYGLKNLQYVNGSTKDFFQLGISPNKTGISIYFIGLKDKKHLANTYGKELGKASITGYCIKFKTLEDINSEILEAALRFGIQNTN